jgi:hypothetical protein
LAQFDDIACPSLTMQVYELVATAIGATPSDAPSIRRSLSLEQRRG